MPLITTQAILLHAIPYGDTSRILKLLSPDAGLVSVIARGARRAKARTGPRLDLFAAGTAGIILRDGRDLHTLSSFEIGDAHARLARDVERFAAAAALVEIILRCAPAEPHPEIFDALVDGLTAIEHAQDAAGPAALTACWNLVGALGFTPTLDRCVVCGDDAGGAIAFSAASGGALCARHRGGMRTANLGASDAADLAALVQGGVPAALDARHLAAHRRLLAGFVRTHLAEHRDMPALAFWEQGSWNHTSS